MYLAQIHSPYHSHRNQLNNTKLLSHTKFQVLVGTRK